MHFTSILTTALLAATALAAPRPRTNMADRMARRAAEGRRTLPPQYVGGNGAHGKATNITGPQYSQNWAGAVLTSPPAGSTFNGVSAQFVVPTPKSPAGSSDFTQYSASAWVGIDGDTYQNAILQTGVDFNIQSGSVSFDAWYEWYPAVSEDFDNIDIKAGDTIEVSVVATSATSGKAVIKNISNGQQVEQDLTSDTKIGGQNAEWIVEDFEQGSSLVPLANFGDVTFTDAAYTTSNGGKGGPTGAQLIDIKQNKKVFTSASVTADSVLVNYL